MQPPNAQIPPMPPITLVGAGRVGGSIHRALLAAGADARLLDRDGIADGCGDAEVVLLCVPDGEIESACRRTVATTPRLRFAGHTSGVAALDAPGRGRRGWRRLLLAAPAADRPRRRDRSHRSAGGDRRHRRRGARARAARSPSASRCVPFEVPEEPRAAYHAAAAIASNFLVALEESAAEAARRGRGRAMRRELLAPLVLRTAANWAERGPRRADRPDRPRRRGDRAAASRGASPRPPRSCSPLYEALAERDRASLRRSAPGRRR